MPCPVYPGISSRKLPRTVRNVTLKRFIAARGNRRDFLETSARNAAGVAAGVAGIACPPQVSSASTSNPCANNVLNLAIIGVRSRGKKLGQVFAQFSDCHVSAICDVAESMFLAASAQIEVHQTRPAWVRDFRRILDDKHIDAVVIATPDHWHGILTIMACQAGKDVYIEKPLAHNIFEEQQIIAAAERYNRVIQVGLQQRSGSHFQTAIDFVRSGQLGTVRLAKAWTAHRRKPIGSPKDSRTPQGVDYDLWLGPAAKRSFNVNRFHHSWRWFWDYGTGELGNWGIHMLDIARLGLNVGLPTRVSSTGRNLYFTDQETPDTQVVGFDFGVESIVWEHRQWCNRGIEGRSAAAAFYGDNGTLIVDRSGWKVYETDADAAEIGADSTTEHCRNFVDAIRTRRQPAGDVESAHLSGMLCHLGNIATRSGTDLSIDPMQIQFGLPAEATALLGREYRDRWSLPLV
jgi:predicted dehydrogenase